MQQNTPEFSSLAAFQAGGYTFGVRRGETDRAAKPLRDEMVSGNYFSTFGLGAFAGRTITPSDDQPNSAPVAMLSYRTWQQQYGSDPTIVGSTFIVSDHPVTIIGITPPGFFGETLRANPPDLWIPINQEPVFLGANSMIHRFQAWLRVIGRVRPGASVSTTGPRMTALVRHWLVNDSGMPADWMAGIKADLPKQNIHVVPAGIGVAVMNRTTPTPSTSSSPSAVSFSSSPAPTSPTSSSPAEPSRRTQTSIRLALGASRKRIVRQTLTESVLLSVFGGIASIAVAFAGVKLIVAMAFRHAHFVPISATPSLPVLAFAFALSLVTGIIFGTAPAWLATHADPAEALRGANRSTRDHASWSQKTLVIVQATLSIVLLTGAGLLTRSLNNLQHQDLGYDTDHRVIIGLTAPWSSYSAPARCHVSRVAGSPLTSPASSAPPSPSTRLSPTTGARWSSARATPCPINDEHSGSSWDHVAPGYLETLGEPILRGRSITEDDTASTQNVAVVNEAFVKNFFKPGEDPIGQHFGLDLPSHSSTYEIVGVVRNAKYNDLAGTEPPRSLFFVPLAQHAHYDNDPMMSHIDDATHYIEGAVLKIHGSSEGLEPQIRRVLSDVDPNLTLLSVQNMTEQVDSNFDQRRAVANMTGLFGILALVLAAVGLYGVTAYTVARRTSEIGVRMALGANRTGIVRLVLRGAFLQILIGLLIGIPASIGCARLISAQLYQVKGWDPIVLVASIATLSVCALVASIIPAQRAASIDPVKALRTE